MASVQVDPATVKEVTNQTEETTQDQSHPVEEKLASTEEDYVPTESETAHEPKEVVLTDQEEVELAEEEVNHNHGEDKAAVSPIEDDLRLTEDIENEGQAEEDDEDE